MQNCPRQLAMQSYVLCSFVRCGTSKQIEEEKKEKKKKDDVSQLDLRYTSKLISSNPKTIDTSK